MCKLCEEAPYGYCTCGCGKPKGKHGCTAHSSTTKLLCNNRAVTSRGMHVCRKHGGTAKTGAAHPLFKHGLYSRHLPDRYLASALAHYNNPARHRLKKQIALLEAREDELFQKMSAGEHGDVWKRANEAAKEMRAAIKRGSLEDAERGMKTLTAALKDGRADQKVWGELSDLWEQKRKLVDTESRIDYRESVAMSLDQAMTLVGAVIATAREIIEDPDDLERFATRIKMVAFGESLGDTRLQPLKLDN